MAGELAVSIPEAARRLALSPRTMASLIAQRAIPSRKIGRRRVIAVRDLENFLRRDHALPPASGARQ
jgi:excisionase family DNA binding protein